jgi:hypothetical protein
MSARNWQCVPMLIDVSRPTRKKYDVRFGSVAVVHPDTTRMSAFGRKADIEYANGGHKKTRYKTGLSLIGSGGALYELYADRD